MFVVIHGGIHGFNFIGPFETRISGEQWLLQQFDCSGDILELRKPADYTGKPGSHVVVFGDPIDGFTVLGTFLDNEVAVKWRNEKSLIHSWVLPLKEFEACL